MAFSSKISICWIIFLSISMIPAAAADEEQFEVGLRANVLLGDGKPANDILGVGLVGRRALQDGWFIGGSLDAYQYDFERPAAWLGIAQDPGADVIDADGSSTVLGVSMGREYGDANNGFRWFWSLGLGVGFPSVDDVSGPVAGGGTFDLTFDSGTEVHVMGAVGTSWYFSSRWSTSLTARLEHHFMDIKITDRVSGATSKIDSQTPMGAYLSLNYRF